MKNHTEIICVLDRSGSMEKIKSDAVGGFNSFLNEQKELPDSASLTLVLFNNRYELIHNNTPLNEVEPISEKVYKTSGTTALFYALGRTIDEVGQRLANTDESERPNKILFIILTDGEENASDRYLGANNEPIYTQERINTLISHQRDVYNWEFVFLAANQDAMSTAEKISISGGNAMNFASSGSSVKAAYSNVNKMSKRFRAASVNSFNGSLFNSDEQDVTKL